jgi:predicted kinase
MHHAHGTVDRLHGWSYGCVSTRIPGFGLYSYVVSQTFHLSFCCTGAGKSHTMRTLVENGHFPLLAFVNVDPDRIRYFIPEFHIYLEQNAELAGELTRKEAGFIAEILTLAGLHAGKNVLVDGSLRDHNWYKQYFARLRANFPGIRIAILHVTAPREAVFQRAEVSIQFSCPAMFQS